MLFLWVKLEMYLLLDSLTVSWRFINNPSIHMILIIIMNWCTQGLFLLFKISLFKIFQWYHNCSYDNKINRIKQLCILKILIFIPEILKDYQLNNLLSYINKINLNPSLNPISFHNNKIPSIKTEKYSQIPLIKTEKYSQIPFIKTGKYFRVIRILINLFRESSKKDNIKMEWKDL